MRRRLAPATLPVKRLPFLESLRGIAALYVVLGHICTLADPARMLGQDDYAPEAVQAAMRPFQFGHLAVAAFIVLSGFCLQLSLFSRAGGRIGSLGQFYRRRALRILPAYYACLAFSVWVCLHVSVEHPELARFLPVTTANVLAHVFLVHNFDVGWMYKINGVLWSIAIEAQLYLVFPLLVMGFAKLGRWRTLVASALLAGGVMATVPQAPKLYPWFLPLFVGGMLAAHMAYRPSLQKGTRPGFAWGIFVIAAAGVVLSATHGDPLALGDAIIGIGVAALAYALTTSTPGMAMDALSWRPLVELGGFSYSLYLMHHPILQIVYGARPAQMRAPGDIAIYLVVFGLPIALLGSYLFSLVFERPFMPRRSVTRHEMRPEFTPLSLPLRTFTPRRSTAGSPAANRGRPSRNIVDGPAPGLSEAI